MTQNSSSSPSKKAASQKRKVTAKRKKTHLLILSKRGWADPRVMRPEGAYVVVQSVHLPDRQPELNLTVMSADDEVLIPKTSIPFRDLAKILHVGAEDLVSGEWARIFGDDWRYAMRSPRKVNEMLLDMTRDRTRDPREKARMAIVFAINLIESLGYLRAAERIRTIVKVGLGISTKHWYTYQ